MHPLFVWATLLILPLLPSVLLYYVFTDLNVFGVQDDKGLIALGPVAFYGALVYVGSQIYTKVNNDSRNKEISTQQEEIQRLKGACSRSSNEYEKLKQEHEQLVSVYKRLQNENSDLAEQLGKFQQTDWEVIAGKLSGLWNFVSVSSHKRTLTGDCEINYRDRRLKLSGSFIEGARRIGGWRTTLAQLVDENSLIIVYEMHEDNDNGRSEHEGICKFQFKSRDSSIPSMYGQWTVIGQADMYGTVHYTKIS